MIEEEATCASLLVSPPIGDDTHGGSTTKKGVGEEAGKRYGKTSFLPVLRSMPKIIRQDCFRQGWQPEASACVAQPCSRALLSLSLQFPKVVRSILCACTDTWTIILAQEKRSTFAVSSHMVAELPFGKARSFVL